MAPEGGIWNYNFMGMKHKVDMEYRIAVENPLEFYDAQQRVSHFLNFSNRSQVGPEDKDIRM